MNHILWMTILCVSSLVSLPVRGEGGSCPDGYYPINGPGVQGCAPIPRNGGAPVNTGPEWETLWIAVAVDGDKGVFGAAKDMPNKRDAKRAALSQCRERGGKSCKLFGTTYNQCLALASGHQYINSFGSPSENGAKSGALEKCEKETNNCQIYFVDCSYPQRVR